MIIIEIRDFFSRRTTKCTLHFAQQQRAFYNYRVAFGSNATCIYIYIYITLILPIPHHYPCLHASEFHSFAKRKGLVLLCVGSPTASPTFGDH